MTLVGHRAKNHPQQATRDDIDDRRTPIGLLDECAALAGVESFDLDPCATPESTKAPRFFTLKDDGLAQEWSGRVWVNPPYSACGAWVRKALSESHRCDIILLLLPANRTEQGWWQSLIEPRRLVGSLTVHFLAGRRRFERPGWTVPAKGDRPPFGLCLVVIPSRPSTHPPDLAALRSILNSLKAYR